MRYRTKIAIFLPHKSTAKSSLWNCVTPDGLDKLEYWGYQAEKKFDDIFSRFDTMQQCDGRTDWRRTTANTALTHSVTRRKSAVATRHTLRIERRGGERMRERRRKVISLCGCCQLLQLRLSVRSSVAAVRRASGLYTVCARLLLLIPTATQA